MKPKWYIFVFIFFLSSILRAQLPNLSFINFNEKDGLPDKYIYSLTQDKSGLIWLGTGSGLYQFNGKNFKKVKKYYKTKTNKNSLVIFFNVINVEFVELLNDQY